jgi:hypothetical protein
MREPRPSATLVDDVLERYLDWRQASRAVNHAYGVWQRVDREQRAEAYAEYCGALDAEERAAHEYRLLIDLVSADAATATGPGRRGTR